MVISSNVGRRVATRTYIHASIILLNVRKRNPPSSIRCDQSPSAGRRDPTSDRRHRGAGLRRAWLHAAHRPASSPPRPTWRSRRSTGPRTGKAGLLAAAVQAALAGGAERAERPGRATRGHPTGHRGAGPASAAARLRAHPARCLDPGRPPAAGPRQRRGRRPGIAASSRTGSPSNGSTVCVASPASWPTRAGCGPGSPTSAGGRPDLDPVRPGQLRRPCRTTRLEPPSLRELADRHARRRTPASPLTPGRRRGTVSRGTRPRERRERCSWQYRP